MEKFAQNGQIILSQAMADTGGAHLPEKDSVGGLGRARYFNTGTGDAFVSTWRV